MAKVYARLIIGKRRTFESVPKNLQDEVWVVLYEMGYDRNGELIMLEE